MNKTLPVIIVLLLALPFVSAGDASFFDGLISYWCMNDSGVGAQDCYGSNDGTAYNGAYWVTDSVYGGCYVLSGNNSNYIEVPDDNTLDITGDFTVSIISNRIQNFTSGYTWGVSGKASTEGANNNMTLYSKWGSVGSRSISLLWYDRFNWGGSSAVTAIFPSGNELNWRTDAVTTTEESTFEHIVFIRNTSSVLGDREEIWINGTMVASSKMGGTDDDGGNLETGSTVLSFGRTQPHPFEKWFNGRLCRITLWDRTLTASELEALYNASGDPFNSSVSGEPPAPEPNTADFLSSIVLYYPLDFNTSDELGVYDLSNLYGNAVNRPEGLVFGDYYFNNVSTLIYNNSVTDNLTGSVAFWVNTSSGEPDEFFTSSDELSNDNFFAVALNNQGTLRVVRNHASAVFITDGSTVLNDGLPHFIVITGNQSIYEFYVDNILETLNGSNDGRWLGSNSVYDNLALGSITRLAATSDYYNGSMDEFILFDKLLNTTEVSTLYNAGLGTSLIGKINNISYSGNSTFNGQNKVADLLININFNCLNQETAVFNHYVNDVLIQDYNTTCNGTYQEYNITYSTDFEGEFYTYIDFNVTNNLPNYGGVIGNETFTADNEPPYINYYTNHLSGAFNNTEILLSLNCSDNQSSLLTYGSIYNGTVLAYLNLSNGTLITNSTELDISNNYGVGSCYDGLFNSTQSLNASFFYKILYLWDEIDNAAFDVTNISEAQVYFDDNSTFFDFKIDNISNVSFIYSTNYKLRFELLYNDTTITRYIDVSLFNDEADIKVCANKEYITHYTQLIISSVIRPVKLKSVFSRCYVAADYTRFAYQDAYLLKAFTISRPYDLVVIDGSTETILTGLDGSISSFYNVDTIEFTQEGYNLNLLGQALSFEKISDSQIKIVYTSLSDMNTSTYNIKRLDTDTIVTSEVADNASAFTVYFDWSTLSNVTDKTLFLVTVTSTDSEGDTTTTKRYLNTAGNVGFINGGLAVGIALLLGVFGFTLTISRTSFSWFGIFILLSCLGILSFAIKEWYVMFMMAIYSVILVYTVFVMVNKNYPTVA